MNKKLLLLACLLFPTFCCCNVCVVAGDPVVVRVLKNLVFRHQNKLQHYDYRAGNFFSYWTFGLSVIGLLIVGLRNQLYWISIMGTIKNFQCLCSSLYFNRLCFAILTFSVCLNNIFAIRKFLAFD